MDNQLEVTKKAGKPVGCVILENLNYTDRSLSTVDATFHSGYTPQISRVSVFPFKQIDIVSAIELVKVLNCDQVCLNF